MNALKKLALWLLATSLVLAAAAILIPKKAVALLATQVFVTNPAVPVTGDVGISGTPTVQLAPGTMVGVTGGTFNFSNTPSTPIFTRDKDNPALTSFQTTLCSGGSSSGSSPCSIPSSFTVGANERLVIEYVSIFCQVQGGASVTFPPFINTTAGGNLSQYAFSPGQTIHAAITLANQQTRIYADPGTRVDFGALGLPGAGAFLCNARLSGNLVTQ
jgi:hypothetical protein